MSHEARALYAIVKELVGDTAEDWLQIAKDEVNAIDPEHLTF